MKSILDDADLYQGFKDDASTDFLPDKKGTVSDKTQANKYFENIKPFKLNTYNLAWAQYRAQQMEYLGQDDSHNWRKTNQEIESGKPAKGLASAPLVWSEVAGGENIGNIVDTTIKNINQNHPFKVNADEGFKSVYALFLDTYNASVLKLGHRLNLANKNYETMGWSMPVTSLKTDSDYRILLVQSFAGSAMKIDLSWLSVISPTDNKNYEWYFVNKLIDQAQAKTTFAGKTHAEIINFLKNKTNLNSLAKTPGDDIYAYNFNFGIKDSYTKLADIYKFTREEYIGSKISYKGNAFSNDFAPYDILGNGTIATDEAKK